MSLESSLEGRGKAGVEGLVQHGKWEANILFLGVFLPGRQWGRLVTQEGKDNLREWEARAVYAGHPARGKGTE